MAQFEMDFSEIEKLFTKNLALVDDVAPKMLDAGGKILASEIAANMPESTKHYANKVKLNKPKKAKNGGWISTVNFTGKAKNGIRLMQLMAYWEYGTYKSQTERIPKTGFLKKAIARSENDVVKKMREVYDEEVNKV